MKPSFHVAVGVVYDHEGNILLTQRPAHKHEGGKWEFAGGKLEPGETVQAALAREFMEELGISPTRILPLIKIPYEYPEHRVLLDVWEIFEFEGTPHDNEGQNIRWVSPLHLDHYEFPTANSAIIRAVQLPHYYLITPDTVMPISEFAKNLRRLFALGIRLCRVRQGRLSDSEYVQRVHAAIEAGHSSGVLIIIDGPVRETWAQVAGFHLNSKDLYHYQERPVPKESVLIASVHNQKDIEQANKLCVDCSVLSPVKSTQTHPGAIPLGWDRFAALTTLAHHPVYGLGGLTLDDFNPVRRAGGQGVSAIRGLWDLGGKNGKFDLQNKGLFGILAVP